MTTDSLIHILKQLTGEAVPFAERLSEIEVSLGAGAKGLGYSQLNELLLLAGLDRVTHSFFAYLQSGKPEYTSGMAFESEGQLRQGVSRFRTMALLTYGNVKFAFKSLSRDDHLLRADLEALQPLDATVFECRHEPLLPVAPIAPEDAYLTGYLIERDLKQRLEADPADEEARALEAKRNEVVRRALRNQTAYLASDHLDVYVATSMRARHEFISIGRTVAEIFGSDVLRPLKLRWFDPTQAYCSNRIDKGLAEALMLRRASCTIYLAQESDTLGKDSELASTLAQGKPVIAFVPDVDEKYLAGYFKALEEADPHKARMEHLLGQLRLFEPEAAWSDPKVQGWCRAPHSAPQDEVEERVRSKIKAHYDGRARTLRETHPLGVQVNLGTGVANGVLVVRTPEDCAALVRGILTRSLELKLEDRPEFTVLREARSQSIFRVMTADAMLTNTFWNFYLDPAE